MKDGKTEMQRHFVVIDAKFKVLMRGCVFENRGVLLTFRHDALGDKHVSESYSSFDCILQMILPGTLPTIQFGEEENLKKIV